MKKTAPLIAFCAEKESGKGVLATYCAGRYGAVIDSFAAPLKRMTMKLTGWTAEQLANPLFKEQVDPRLGVSPRWFMQTLGTECVRDELGENAWTDALHRRLSAVKPWIMVVIDDLRFPNEAKFLYRQTIREAFNIRIVRPGRSRGPDKHVSEQVDRVPVDAVLSVPWMANPEQGDRMLIGAFDLLVQARLPMLEAGLAHLAGGRGTLSGDD